MKQKVRIIGGLYRGKQLSFPAIEGLRPTPDRVRETLFNWLMNETKGSYCLDAFAGSGALGLEAFSRGASHVTFIEHHDQTHAHLKKTIALFNTSQLKVLREDTFTYFARSKEQFDLIFLDPPFSQDLIARCLALIFNKNLLKKEGMVYCESASSLPLDPNWQQLKAKQAGQVYYGLYRLH